MKVPVKGLEELVDETKKCLQDAMRNHFLRVQKVKIQARKQAMIEECKTIIHVASGATGAAGLIPIPFSDALAIAPIQAGMIYKMNDAFEVSLGKSATPTFITEISSIIALVQVGRTLVNGFLKFIPVVGSVAEGATAAVITEGIGFAYLKVLEYYYNDETGEVDLPDISVIVDLLKSYYKIFYDEQKKLKP
ncbi:YcjF family protein [Helicobacter pylori]